MRLIAGGLLALLAALALALWATGGFDAITWWVANRQRDLQATLAAQIQAIRTGQPAAFWTLIGACATYGFVHAIGPGHGKVLVAGAAVATRATAARMALIAVLGSLAQALVAILIVYGAFAVFEATARGAMDSVDRWIAPLGNAAIAAIGAWLLLRGLRSLRPAEPSAAGAAVVHHGHSCGHAHGPSPEQAARATSPAATLALIGGMAARPCTGALVVLVLAWRFGLEGAGAAAVIAMGLGTAAFTVLVAVLAVTSRDAAFLTAGDGTAGRILGPGLQIVAGGLIFALSGALVVGQLAS